MRAWGSYAFLVLALAGLCACWLLPPPQPDDSPEAIPGAAIFSWKDLLYVLGGRAASGSLRAEVWVASINAEGMPTGWKRTVDLPEGRAFASVLVSGSFVYVIGGETSSGASDDVLFALIDSTETSETYGELRGFTLGWERLPRGLPVAVGRSAPVLHDGKIFLIGGQAEEQPTDSVLYARIRNDGSVGEWYYSPFSLPGAREGAAAAVHEGRLWVMAGRDSAGFADSALSAEMVEGLPGAWREEAAPGIRGIFPVATSATDGLLLLGGWNGVGASLSGRTMDSAGVWQSTGSVAAPAYGPACATLRGRVYFVSGINGSLPPEVGYFQLEVSRSDAPTVTPGSGWVRTGMVPGVVTVPGEEAHFTIGTPAAPPEAPTDASPVWAAGLSIQADTVLRFRCFKTGRAGSPEVSVTYRVRSGSMFPLVSGSTSPTADPDIFVPFSLEERYSDGSTSLVNAIWVRLSVVSRGIYSLRSADSADPGTAGSYTAAVRVSVFEADTYNAPYDRSGVEATGRPGTYSVPLSLELAPATYYMLVESQDGQPGGSFGISFAPE